ncbi:Hypothetical predicted protein [Paramuricea clavata]|uniref:Uncharacterized protein n=1 Tax=Paramuricea clavata TaxID=317549 RepID=A0A6S7HAX2_PARCT|nr:Hypothetical predicted protein [Paramuricea clavata]
MKFAKDLMDLLLKGGFRLTKWCSSNKKVRASIPEAERAGPSLNLDLDQLPVKRALGLHWTVEDDTFKFSIVKLDNPETKRGVLATIASLYATPITLATFSLLCCLQIEDGRLKLALNSSLAKQRLDSTERKLLMDPELAAAYQGVIINNEYLEKGYIRQVPLDEPKPECEWLLPHFPVVRPERAQQKFELFSTHR